jgi:mannosyltransferase OCH1-like enzyme
MINEVHFIWIGTNSLPTEYQKGLQSFYNKHPYWKVNLWMQADINKIIQKSRYSVYRFKSFINRYNFVKYHILAEYGGWFVDLDIFWKKSLDDVIKDKVGSSSFPDLIVPVRVHPLSKVNIQVNDDMLIYTKKDILWELIEVCEGRTDYDKKTEYEPYGPVSLSRWLHSSNYSREYLYENEIQKNGVYCEHRNLQGWKYNS